MAENVLKREDILRIVRELDFMGPDCWLTAGAALVLQGVKETTHDVDVVCSKETADLLEGRGVPFRRSEFDQTRIFAVSGQVEVLENWFTDEVVAVDGVRVASVESVRNQKAVQGRPKDQKDIEWIDRFLGRGPIRLETERMILRDYTPADEEEYYRLKTNEKTMGRYMRDIMLHSREEAREEFAAVLADAAKPERKFCFLRAERKEDGIQMGSVGYTVEGRTPAGKLVHAGYFYLPEFWGRGYGTEAFRRVMDFAFLEDGVYRLSTGCLAENKGSERIMRKCGLVKEAERPGWEWHDGEMKTRLEYRLLLPEYMELRGKEV